MSATELEKALRMFLNAQKQKRNQFAKGKQTLKELIGQNAGVTNIEVNEGNIKAFERVARKYGVDFALKKDRSGEKPKYLVFFKARDGDALTAAFKEYTAKTDRKKERPSVLQTLRKLKEQAATIDTPKVRKKEIDAR